MKQSQEQKKEFDELYEYVKKEVFHYDNNQSLPSIYVLGLKGLAKGKAVENKKIKDRADYGYKVVLAAFILSKPKIDYHIRTKNFKSDSNMFRYITKIVEGNLNYAYEKMKSKNNSNEKVRNINLPKKTDIEYKKRTNENKNDLTNKLW